MSQIFGFLNFHNDLVLVLYNLLRINMEHMTVLTFKRQVDCLEVTVITVGLQCRGGKLNGFFNDNFLIFSNINDFHVRT